MGQLERRTRHTRVKLRDTREEVALARSAGARNGSATSQPDHDRSIPIRKAAITSKLTLSSKARWHE
jgi:hypothetical protein